MKVSNHTDLETGRRGKEEARRTEKGNAEPRLLRLGLTMSSVTCMDVTKEIQQALDLTRKEKDSQE